MGKYEKACREAFEEGELYLGGSTEMNILSLKVLDLITEEIEGLPVKSVIEVLDNAKDALLSLLGA